MQHLIRELNLTEEQQAKIRPIVDETAPLIKMIHEEAAAKMKAVMNGAVAQVRPLLNPDQQVKLDELRKRIEAGRAAAMQHRPGAFGHRPQPPTEKPPGDQSQNSPDKAPAPDANRGPAPGGDRGQGRNPVERLTRELNLTPDQQAKLKTAAEELTTQMRALRDDTAVSPEDRRAKMRGLMENLESQVRPLLTPEQVEKLNDIKAKWRSRGGQQPPPPNAQTPPPAPQQ